MSARPATQDLLRVVCGATLLVVTWREALRPELPDWEGPAFDAVNHLPEGFRASWPIMQFGSFAAIPVVAAATAKVSGDRRAAVHVGAAGLGAYLGAKLIKTRVGRGRPGVMRPGARLREDASGLGYPSGHTAVATAMATTLAMHLPPPWRAVPHAAAVVVGLSRVYVGAHLPHDVLGGAALGAALGGGTNLVTRSLRHG